MEKTELEQKLGEIYNEKFDLESANNSLQQQNKEMQQELKMIKKSKGYRLFKKVYAFIKKIKRIKYKMAYIAFKMFEKNPRMLKLLHKINNRFRIVKDYNAVLSSNVKKTNNRYKTSGRRIKSIRVAMIADEFTYNSFKHECVALPIEPGNWKQIFKKEKPEIFFCESAWSGADSEKRPWKGRVYASCNFKYNNRRELFKILKYCKRKNIPTVFWNKEDPSHYDDKVHNFVKTAILFDYIYTTAEECIEGYKQQCGHRKCGCTSICNATDDV